MLLERHPIPFNFWWWLIFVITYFICFVLVAKLYYLIKFHFKKERVMKIWLYPYELGEKHQPIKLSDVVLVDRTSTQLLMGRLFPEVSAIFANPLITKVKLAIGDERPQWQLFLFRERDEERLREHLYHKLFVLQKHLRKQFLEG